MPFLLREGAVALYGFATGAEKQAFDLLTRLQRVGPKLALGALSVMSPEELAAAIVRGDIDRVDAVPGGRRKVAERAVRELSDRGGEAQTRGARTSCGSVGWQGAGSRRCGLGAGKSRPQKSRNEVCSRFTRRLCRGEGVETIIRRSMVVLLGEK